MAVSCIAAMFMGILLRILGLPCWLVCGSVAATAVVAEHYLTLHPLFVLKYITLPEEKEDKKKCKK
jgi:hypothetical protein